MFRNFVSTTSPMPSPERKKIKITPRNNNLLLAQAIGYAQLQMHQYSHAVDCLVAFCNQNYKHVSTDELLEITRLFSKLSHQLAFDEEYESLQRLQQVALHFTDDENVPDYVKETAHENANLIEEHKEQAQFRTHEQTNIHDGLIAQIIGYLELGEKNYTDAVRLLRELITSLDDDSTESDENIFYIYQNYSKRILSLHNLELGRELQLIYNKFRSYPDIAVDYQNNNIFLCYQEFNFLFEQGQCQQALPYFINGYPKVSSEDLPYYYLALSDNISVSNLQNLQKFASEHIKSNDPEYLTKYYYNQGILNIEDPNASITAFKTCIEHAKERSSTATIIHLCLKKLEQLMTSSGFSLYKQQLIDGFYFGMIDSDQRTLKEWRYFDPKNFFTQDWLLLVKAVTKEITAWKKDTTLEATFVENMNCILDFITFTKNNLEKCQNFCNDIDADVFNKKNPDFFNKFEQLIKTNLPYSQSATSSPTVSSASLSDTATAKASADAEPQIMLRQQLQKHSNSQSLRA